MAANDVVLNIRARGGRQAARETDAASRGIRRIGKAATDAGKGMDSLGRKLTVTPFRAIGNQARYAAYGLEAIGVFAIGAGLKFNASMEQNQLAFTHFLGSSKAARQELSTLYNLAKVTPFEFSDLTLATRKFLAFGFSVKDSNALLKTVADTASGLALDQGGIDRMVLAIGQIKSKGTLQAQDLRQLQELGAVDLGRLAKSLGVTRAEMGDIGKQHISSTKALRALKAQWDHTFGGMSAKQAKTFSGQLSTLRDNTNQLLGAITKPGFDRLRKDVFPALNQSAEAIQRIFNPRSAKYGKLDLAEKIDLSRDVLRRKLGPITEELSDEFKRLRLGDKLADAFEAAAPKLMNAAGKAAAKGAEAFVKGWWHAGPYGKLFALGLLTAWLGGFSALGRVAAGRFRAGWRKRIGKLPTPTATPTLGPGGGGGGPVPVPGGGAKKGGWLRRTAGRLGRGAARWGGKALRLAPWAAAAATAWDALANADDAGMSDAEERAPFRPTAQPRRQPRAQLVRGRHRGDTVIHTHVHVNGKEVAKATNRVNADRDARR